MVRYSLEKKVDLKRLAELFDEVGWNDKTADIPRLEAMIRNSQIVVTAWEKDNMVGFACCVTDHVYHGQINHVVVDSGFHGQGIGRELVKKIIDDNNKVTYVLRGDPENAAFYKRLGFLNYDLCFVFHRIQ